MIFAILSLILLISVAINVFLIWFSWKSLKQIAEYDEELREISSIMERFTTHLKGVYELEMFYGDETLRHLLRHATDIIAVFESYDLLLQEEEEYDDYGDNFEQES
jgi:predicted tellurium resistance membrane protein TerC|tara:strand:+ start:184 stop:501 length:318 start_codon:yes stop_codon:yes gene_type:complete